MAQHAACPKCGHPNAGASECVACGLIFARYEAAQEKRRTARPDPVKPKHSNLNLFEMGRYARFFRSISRLLTAGMPLTTALKDAAEGGSLNRMARKTVQELDRGLKLTQAFAAAGAAWPGYVWGHIEGGEITGRLPETFDALARDLEARRSHVLSRIFNLRALLFLLILFGAIFSLSVTGSISTLTGETLSDSPQAVLTDIGLSMIPRLILWTFFFFGGLACYIFYQLEAQSWLTEHFPGFEAFRLGLPFYGSMSKNENLRRYGQLLADLLASGLPLPRALDLAASEIEFPQWRKSFGKMREIIESGGSLSQALARVPHIPANLIAEVRLGEKTGGLVDGLKHFEKEMTEDIQRRRTTATAIQTATLFLLSVIIVIVIRGFAAYISMLEKI